MRAAIISEYAEPPRIGERREPEAAEARTVVALHAASLNPADIAVASGTFPAGSPPLPYVPGIEGVGTVVASGRFRPGARVWASGRGLGIAVDGTLADRFSVSDETVVEVPTDVDDVPAAAFGVAGLAGWMPVSWAAPVVPGETVLVLGATGNAGRVAVQAAKLLGAGRVIAAGRDEVRLEKLRELGADATVPLSGEDIAAHLIAAADGTPLSLVVDALWGAPLEAALVAAAPAARIVHLGQSAGPIASIASGLVRGKQLRIIGYSNFGLSSEVLTEGYTSLMRHVAAERIALEVETVAFEDVAGAWERQRGGPDAKLVLVA
jgi:NADPH:quinone reductase